MAMPVLNERMSESALLAAGCKRREYFAGGGRHSSFLSLNFIQELLFALGDLF